MCAPQQLTAFSFPSVFITAMLSRTRHSIPKISFDCSSEANVNEKPKQFDNSLKVFIKNLPIEDKASFSTLLEHMTPCGTVQHSHFFVKLLAGQKIQQGLVVFSTEEEAESATKITGTVIGGFHVIVSRYRQYAQPTSKTVFVSNLPVETSEENLWELFENSGTIKFIHINRPLNACSLRAEVHFKSEKSAQKARKLSGQSLEGNAIEVFSPLEIESQSLNQCSKEYPVFVAGLPHDIQKEDLVKFFDGCGPIKRIKIKSFKEEGEGQAVVFFMDSESADNAISCNGNEFSGYVLSVTQREEGILHYDFLNPVYVAGISRDTKDVDIFLKFQDCGLIHDIKFVQSKKGSLKKCVIEFKELEGMERALTMTDLEVNDHVLAIGKTRDIWSRVHTTTTVRPKKRKIKESSLMDPTSPLENESSILMGEENKKKKKKDNNKKK